jgi:pimeloyl-ACP methyl ester carboxylesterase
MYYEVYGRGSPLVLLHGGMLTIELNFATLIPTLADRHRVIGVEMQGHGRTADIDHFIAPAGWRATLSDYSTSSASTGHTSSGTAWARR